MANFFKPILYYQGASRNITTLLLVNYVEIILTYY